MSQSPSTTPPDAPAAPRRRWFGCLSIVLALVAIVILAVALALWMAKSEPAEWREMNAMIAGLTIEEKAKRADGLEASIGNASQGIDGKTGPVVTPNTKSSDIVERDLSVGVADVNIWLATKLDAWLANQGSTMPKIVSDPRVWIEEEQIVLSARVLLPGANIDGVVSFGLEAQMREDGQIAMKIAKVRTGKLRVPTGVVADQLKEEFKNAQAGAVQMIGKAFDGMTLDPVFPDGGDKNRSTRVVDFKIHPDRVDLKIRNGPKDKMKLKVEPKPKDKATDGAAK